MLFLTGDYPKGKTRVRLTCIGFELQEEAKEEVN